MADSTDQVYLEFVFDEIEKKLRQVYSQLTDEQRAEIFTDKYAFGEKLFDQIKETYPEKMALIDFRVIFSAMFHKLAEQFSFTPEMARDIVGDMQTDAMKYCFVLQDRLKKQGEALSKKTAATKPI